MDPPKFQNGTRLFCHCLLPHVIEAIIMASKYASGSVFIPRIPLIPNGDNYQLNGKDCNSLLGESMQ